jgi:signal transduction histidine kinase
VPLFLHEFSELLAATGQDRANKSKESELATSATKHGNDMLRRGYTIAQVVHDYGDVCQAVTELASEQGREHFDTKDFHTLNLCLDDAIAGAVTEYSRQREQNLGDQEIERLGFLGHELRNGLSSVAMAFQVLQSGRVGVGGSTSGLVERGLTNLRHLVDRTLAEVRLGSGQHRRERVMLAEFIEEVAVTAALDAKARKLALTVPPVEYGVCIDADRQLLASAVSNLLHNAFKFTHEGGQVALRAQKKSDRVLIEVEDECGGMPAGQSEELFKSFGRRHADKSGLGLGLAISRRSATVNGGELQVQNKPGKGCVFSIGLPLAH